MCMKTAPLNVVIIGKHYECRVFGDTEAETADAAELVLHQLRKQHRVWPVQIHIEGDDVGAMHRLAAYFADVTAEPDLD